MATELKQMTGEEFVRKVLDGERNFSGIELEKGFDLSGYEGFKDLQDYLKQQNLKENPVNITRSQFRCVKAAGLYLPFVNGEEVNLMGAYLREAHLMGANLGEAYLMGANLMRANLERACLMEADLGGACLVEAHLEGADLRGADLGGAHLMGANLERADLKNVRGLEKALIAEARFLRTKVTKKEKRIIEEAFKPEEFFIVEE